MFELNVDFGNITAFLQILFYPKGENYDVVLNDEEKKCLIEGKVLERDNFNIHGYCPVYKTRRNFRVCRLDLECKDKSLLEDKEILEHIFLDFDDDFVEEEWQKVKPNFEKNLNKIVDLSKKLNLEKNRQSMGKITKLLNEHFDEIHCGCDCFKIDVMSVGVKSGETVLNSKKGSHIVKFNGDINKVKQFMLVEATGINNEVILTNAKQSKKVIGVVDEILDNQNLIIKSTGEGMIYVSNCNGGISIGDYICSCQVEGYGMKQTGINNTNYTIAKATVDEMFNDGYEWVEKNGIKYKVKMISCIYLL